MSPEKQFALEQVRRNGENLWDFPEFQNDREVVLKAVKNSGRVLQYASDELKRDVALLDMYIEYEISEYSGFEHWSKLFKEDGANFDYDLAEAIWKIKTYINWDNREYVLSLIGEDVDVVSLAPDYIRDDESIMRYAMDCNPIIFPALSDRLRSDYTFALQAIQDEMWDLGNFGSLGDEIMQDAETIKYFIDLLKERHNLHDFDKFIRRLMATNDESVIDERLPLYKQYF